LVAAYGAALFLVKGRVAGRGVPLVSCIARRELGLRGWVRNTRTATWEVLAAGEPEQLDMDSLMCALSKGSRGSRVDDGGGARAGRERGAELRHLTIEGAL